MKTPSFSPPFRVSSSRAYATASSFRQPLKWNTCINFVIVYKFAYSSSEAPGFVLYLNLIIVVRSCCVCLKKFHCEFRVFWNWSHHLWKALLISSHSFHTNAHFDHRSCASTQQYCGQRYPLDSSAFTFMHLFVLLVCAFCKQLLEQVFIIILNH